MEDSYCDDSISYCGDNASYCDDNVSYCGDNESFADDDNDYSSEKEIESFADDMDSDDDAESDVDEFQSDSDSNDDDDSDNESVKGSESDSEASYASSTEKEEENVEQPLFEPSAPLVAVELGDDISENALSKKLIYRHTGGLSVLKPKDLKHFKQLLGNGNGMIMFYSPSCPHCVDALPQFTAAAARLAGGGRTFGVIDGSAHSDIIDLLDIEYFPFMVFLKNGKLDKLYSGKRDAEYLYDAIIRYFMENNIKLPASIKSRKTM